jgi:transcriptional regulator with XRE-family HTH domain
LREWRDTAGVTQYELGRCLGIDQSHLSKIELGKMTPCGRFAAKVEILTGIPARDWYPDVVVLVPRRAA